MENVEQKLQLVQQVRSRYQENRYDLSNRERILYGRTSVGPETMDQAYPCRGQYGLYGDTDPAEAQPLSFFKLRMWIALFLVTAVIVMDRNGSEMAGITAEKVFQMISVDYEEVIEAWVESISR